MRVDKVKLPGSQNPCDLGFIEKKVIRRGTESIVQYIERRDQTSFDMKSEQRDDRATMALKRLNSQSFISPFVIKFLKIF